MTHSVQSLHRSRPPGRDPSAGETAVGRALSPCHGPSHGSSSTRPGREGRRGSREIANDAHETAKSNRTGAYLWQADDSGEWAVSYVLPQVWVAQLAASIEQRLGASGRWSRFTEAAGLTPEPS